MENENLFESEELTFCTESQTFKSTVNDSEYDLLECTFLCDETVSINTSGLEYIQLDEGTLLKLLSHLQNASKQFETAEYDEENQVYLIS